MESSQTLSKVYTVLTNPGTSSTATMHRLRFDSCAALCKAAAASFILCSLLFGSLPGCCAACCAAAAAQTAGSTPGGGGIKGGKPGTNPKGGIIGKGGAFGGVGAFAGAGAAAAFSFLTLEAGFLGMLECCVGVRALRGA